MDVIALILALTVGLPQEAKPETKEDRAARTPEERASNRLRGVERRLADALYAYRPALTRRRGLKATGDEVVRIDNESARAWQSAVDLAARELPQIEWQDLSPDRRIDHAWLGGFVASEAMLDAIVPAERWDPSLYVEEIHALLRGFAEGESDPNVRMTEVTQHLGLLPAQLETARETVIFPRPAFSEYAILRTGELRGFIDVELIPLLETEGLDPTLWRPFEAAQAEAQAAVDEFDAWLTGVASSRFKANPRLGTKNWTQLVRELTGNELEPDALKVRLLRDISALDAALGDYRVVKPATPEDVHRDAICARVGAVSKEARELLKQLEIVVEPLPDLGCDAAKAHVFPGREARLDMKQVPVLAFTTDGVRWPTGLRLTRAQWMRPVVQRALALQVGYPGEALWNAWAFANKSLVQRRLWNPCQEKGWGLFAADWVTRVAPEENAFARDPELAAEVRRLRLREAARLYCAMELHAGGVDEKKAAANYRDLTGVDPDSAAFEVRSALVDPLHGAAYLVYLELRAAETELLRNATETEAIRILAAAVAAHPSATMEQISRHTKVQGAPDGVLDSK